MSDALVKRLRGDMRMEEDPKTGDRRKVLSNPVGPEAADYIEALEAENARLREDNADLWAGFERYAKCESCRDALAAVKGDQPR